jgi:hypothetical protein
MEKMKNKERFSLSHGTATAISRNRKRNWVALGFCAQADSFDEREG